MSEYISLCHENYTLHSGSPECDCNGKTRLILKLGMSLDNISIWIISIKMPRELMTDIERGSVEYAGETVDLQDVEDAEMQNLDQAAVAPEMEEELV